jgi:hypothetical protein
MAFRRRASLAPLPDQLSLDLRLPLIQDRYHHPNHVIRLFHLDL